jgi:hypothetical protein
LVGTPARAEDPAGQQTSPDQTQTQPAPIVHAYGGQNAGNPQAGPMSASRAITTSHPIVGVALRAEASASVQTVSADAKGTELRIEHGIANISVHHPSKDARILVDLPGGQTAILKDGLYTFNAGTNIVRVLKGEADAYPGAAQNGVKVKEDHQFAFGGIASGNRSVEVSSREELMADYLPPNAGDGYRGGVSGAYGYGPYGDGYYGYPPLTYSYFGYPYGYYPYGYGFGLGLGYYGGFGGFRGGGFRGGRFR